MSEGDKTHKSVLSDKHVAAIDALVMQANVRRKNIVWNWLKDFRQELAVTILGFVLSICLFFGTQNVIKNYIDKQRIVIAENITSKIVKVTNDTAYALDFVSRISDDQGAMHDLKNYSQDHFVVLDQIFLKAPREYKGLYNKADTDKINLSALQGYDFSGDSQIMMAEDIFQTTTLSIDNHSTFQNLRFFLVRQGADDRMVVGVVNFTHLFQSLLGHEMGFVASLVLRDTQTNQTYFSYYRSNISPRYFKKPAQEYLMDIWGQQVSLQMRFYNPEKISMLLLVPLIVSFLGALITCLGLLLVKSQKAKRHEFLLSKQALETKNFELDIERLERERLNKVIRDHESEHLAIINSINDVVLEVDQDGVICFMSHAISKSFGYEPDDMTDKNIFDYVHSDQAEKQLSRFSAMFEANGELFKDHIKIRAANGTYRNVIIAFTMLRQKDPQSRRAVATLTDVEDHRRAERALKETEEKYRNIVEHSATGIYQMAPEGLYLSGNPAMAEFLGFESPEQMLRDVKNANETIYVDTAERMKFIHRLAKEGSISNHETRLKRNDGSEIWVSENARCVTDDDGNLLYYEGSIEDVTQRKGTEIEMAQARIESDMANRAKNEFLANMSHELRTPLNSIIGFSEMIKSEVLGKIEPKEYWEYAKDIHESGQGLLGIINEILDISRIEAKDRELNESVCDLPKILSSCLELTSTRFSEKKISLQCELENIPRVVAEERALKQIFMNLLSNAAKFTPENGRVNISYQLNEKGQLRMSVTDTGIGLTEDEIEKALSAFGQVDNELSRSGSGTGLGLTLVDSLVKLHQGKLELISQKGVGTSVTIVLPVERVVMNAEDEIS